MQRGQVVTLDARFGEIQRVIVEDLGQILLVCRKDEFQAAEKEGRIPIAIGFPKEAIIK